MDGSRPECEGPIPQTGVLDSCHVKADLVGQDDAAAAGLEELVPDLDDVIDSGHEEAGLAGGHALVDDDVDKFFGNLQIFDDVLLANNDLATILITVQVENLLSVPCFCCAFFHHVALGSTSSDSKSGVVSVFLANVKNDFALKFFAVRQDCVSVGEDALGVLQMGLVCRYGVDGGRPQLVVDQGRV